MGERDSDRRRTTATGPAEPGFSSMAMGSGRGENLDLVVTQSIFGENQREKNERKFKGERDKREYAGQCVQERISCSKKAAKLITPHNTARPQFTTYSYLQQEWDGANSPPKHTKGPIPSSSPGQVHEATACTIELLPSSIPRLQRQPRRCEVAIRLQLTSGVQPSPPSIFQYETRTVHVW
jgi:hypothetical protein